MASFANEPPTPPTKRPGFQFWLSLNKPYGEKLCYIEVVEETVAGDRIMLGDVFMLKNMSRADNLLQYASPNLTHDALGHPCVVIGLPIRKDAGFEICSITSLGQRDINLITNRDWLPESEKYWFLPIAPTPENKSHPNARLRTSTGARMIKEGYVYAGQIYTVSVKLLDHFGGRTDTHSHRLDMRSVQFVQQVSSEGRFRFVTGSIVDVNVKTFLRILHALLKDSKQWHLAIPIKPLGMHLQLFEVDRVYGNTLHQDLDGQSGGETLPDLHSVSVKIAFVPYYLQHHQEPPAFEGAGLGDDPFSWDYALD